MEWYEAVGTLGFFFSLTAYACVQWRRDFAKTFKYSAMNLVSVLLVSVTFIYQWNTASFIGNSVWGMISVYGLVRCMRYHRRRHLNQQKHKA